MYSALRTTARYHCDGQVILHGNVHSWAERKKAQQAAWSAPGVTSVESDITVTP